MSPCTRLTLAEASFLGSPCAAARSTVCCLLNKPQESHCQALLQGLCLSSLEASSSLNATNLLRAFARSTLQKETQGDTPKGDSKGDSLKKIFIHLLQDIRNKQLTVHKHKRINTQVYIHLATSNINRYTLADNLLLDAPLPLSRTAPIHAAAAPSCARMHVCMHACVYTCTCACLNACMQPLSMHT